MLSRRIAYALVLLSGSVAGHAAAPAPLGLGQVVIIIGPPGSGKTLQSDSLSKKYKIPVISVAKLLNAKKGKPNEGTVQAAMASGELLGDKAAIDLIQARASQADAGKGFILDGYPSSEAQAQFLDNFVAQQGLHPPKVIVLDAPDDVVRERLLKRKRADDTPANINRRIKAYREEEAFLNSWYKHENTVRVDATQTPAVVLVAIEQGLVEMFDKKGFKAREAPAK